MIIGRCGLAFCLVVFSIVSPQSKIIQVPSAFCELGSGSLIGCANQNQLAVAASPARVISIWGGARRSIFMRADGTVWGMGFNYFGSLGDGTASFFSPADFSNDRHTPIQVHGPGNAGTLTSINAIMGGEAHSFALKSDGTVWAWGSNSMGQVGDGTFTDRYSPVQVSGLTSITSLGGRGYHSLAIRSDGTVWAWGDNANGQLGDGTTTNRNVPVEVVGLNHVLDVTGGGFYSLALMADHILMSWGKNPHGELGDGTNTEQHLPVAVSGLSNVSRVSAGWFHAAALKSDGTVWTWGQNTNGQLGDGTVNKSNVPVQVKGLSQVIAVSAGDCSTAAIKADGTVWTWGCNDVGELGIGTHGANQESLTPVQVKGLSHVIAIAARDYHNLAIELDGSVWGWGANDHGQLGDNTTTDQYVPVQVIEGTGLPSNFLFLAYICP